MITQTLHRKARQLIIQLIGNRCDLCNEKLSSQSVWCEDCLLLIPNKSRCKRCGAPQVNAESHCGECISHPVLWDRLYCVSDYEAPISDYVKRIKYTRQFWHSRVLAQLLSEKIIDPAPLLLSVPTHWRRLVWRGFNQSHYLAYYLSQGLDIHYLPDVLIRTRHTKMQMELDRSKRLKNLNNAFQINPARLAEMQRYHRVAIVDDVVTTGATVGEICKLLRQIGVEEIEVYCLCRASRG